MPVLQNDKTKVVWDNILTKKEHGNKKFKNIHNQNKYNLYNELFHNITDLYKELRNSRYTLSKNRISLKKQSKREDSTICENRKDAQLYIFSFLSKTQISSKLKSGNSQNHVTRILMEEQYLTLLCKL
jgi:hypothetical protein